MTAPDLLLYLLSLSQIITITALMLATASPTMAQPAILHDEFYYSGIAWPSYHQELWHPPATPSNDPLPAFDYHFSQHLLEQDKFRVPGMPLDTNILAHRLPSTTSSLGSSEHDWVNQMTFDDLSSICSLSSSSDLDIPTTTISYREVKKANDVIQPVDQLESEACSARLQYDTETQGHRPQQRRRYVCSHPDCKSSTVFKRPCDFRKHLKRHIKRLPCRVSGCPQSWGPSFADAKDRERHEASHRPSIVCEWKGCDRVFSRRDNMLDHVKRVHFRERKRPA